MTHRTINERSYHGTTSRSPPLNTIPTNPILKFNSHKHNSNPNHNLKSNTNPDRKV